MAEKDIYDEMELPSCCCSEDEFCNIVEFRFKSKDPNLKALYFRSRHLGWEFANLP